MSYEKRIGPWVVQRKKVVHAIDDNEVVHIIVYWG
jgi:hypothetical protein